MTTNTTPSDGSEHCKCPVCGAREVEATTPRTVYTCGSYDYDQRPDSFIQECIAPPSAPVVEQTPEANAAQKYCKGLPANEVIPYLVAFARSLERRFAAQSAELERVKAEAERCPNPLCGWIPQTYGEAVRGGWITGLECENYEWDNRTTAENAKWLIEHLRAQLATERQAREKAEAELIAARKVWELSPMIKAAVNESRLSSAEADRFATWYGEQKERTDKAERELAEARNEVEQLRRAINDALSKLADLAGFSWHESDGPVDDIHQIQNLLISALTTPAPNIIAELNEKSELFDILDANSWGLVPVDVPTGGDDADIAWHVIEYRMGKPSEVVIGRGETPVKAIRSARQEESK